MTRDDADMATVSGTDTGSSSSDLEESFDAALREIAAAPSVKPKRLVGETIGDSFVIERFLGRGGMGIVYLAWDKQLERHVAVKLHHGGNDASALQRLAREARAMARLSHPNVLPVHEVGEHDGRLFVAMEFVEGGTLRQWLDAKPRTPAEILDVFVQAGRGLSAAHELGLVHRDFKPDNVLVGDDGRPRVADFGLARLAGEIDPEPEPEPEPEPSAAVAKGTRRSSSLRAKLTQTGAWVGTLAYMAPEQYGGLDVDARADQFAFCVALFEALLGQRPFTGDTAANLFYSIHRGQIFEPTARRGVPARVFRALRRGLAADRDDRFPTMTALLAALSRKPVSTTVVATSGALVLSTGVLVVALFPERGAEPCADARTRLTAAWDPETQETVRAAIARTGKAWTDNAFTRVRDALDDYAREWGEAYANACEATHVRKDQSQATLELRVACLERGRRAFTRLVDDLSGDRAGAELRMVERARALPPVEPCADVEVLARVVPLPEDPELRERALDVQAGIDEAVEHGEAGDLMGARTQLEALLVDAEATAHRPTIGNARLELALVRRRLGEANAVDDVRRALDDALASGDDGLAVDAVAALVRLSADVRSAEAEHWADTGWALLARYGDDPDRSIELLRAQGFAQSMAHDYASAIGSFEQAAARVADIDPEDPRLAAIWFDLARAHGSAAHPEQAMEYGERGLELTRQSLGPSHPEVGRVLGRLGRLAIQRSDFDRAFALLEEGRALLVAGLGEEHPDVALVDVNIADCLWSRGETERALAIVERAVAVLRESEGGDQLDHVEAEIIFGSLLHANGRWDESIEVLTRVAHDPKTRLDPQLTAYALKQLSSAYMYSGRLDEAIVPAREAVEVIERHGLPTGLASALVRLAEIEIRRESYAKARDPLERAVALFESHGLVPFGKAHAQSLLAEVLWHGGEHERAQELAHAALAFFSSRDDHESRLRVRAVEDLLSTMATKAPG